MKNMDLNEAYLNHFDFIKKYKRINVCGCPGAGKSTLSKKLSSLTGYTIYDLDDYLYNPNCKRKSIEETNETIEKILNHKCFIIDGTYFTSFEQRLANIDLVVLVETSTFSSLTNFFKRLFMQKTLKCGERITLKTFKLMLTFNASVKDKIIDTTKKNGVEIFAYHKSKNSFSCQN